MALDVEDVVAEAVHSVSGWPRVLPEGWAILSAELDTGAAAGVAAEGAEATAASAAIAGAIGTLVFIGIAIAIIVAILALSWIVRTLSQLLRRVPWVGNTIAGLFSGAAGIIWGMSDSTAKQLVSLQTHLWHDLTTAIGYFADRHASHTAPAKIPGHTATTNAINSNLQHLQGEINTLNVEVGALSTSVGQKTGVQPSQAVTTLQDQLHQLQANINILYHNQVAMNTFEKSLASSIATLSSELQNLAHNVVGVRAVEVGFQDIVSQIDKLERIDRDINARQDTAISHLAHTVNSLSPLSILTEPGLAGIQNLRKLEDNICQCPSFGGIGADLAAAIALYEVLTNG